MNKILTITFAILVYLFTLTACSSESIQDSVSKELGINVLTGKEISSYDTHGGNGDGTTCIAFSFENDKVLEEIKSNSDWKAFPLDETVGVLVYGVSDETSKVGPFLNDNNGNPLVPEIQNGYYLLIDRQTENDNTNSADILHRNTFNFTLGLYDTDTNTLYFCQLDT